MLSETLTERVVGAAIGRPTGRTQFAPTAAESSKAVGWGFTPAVPVVWRRADDNPFVPFGDD